MKSKKLLTGVLSTAFLLSSIAPAVSANSSVPANEEKTASILSVEQQESETTELRTVTTAAEEEAIAAAEISRDKAIEIAKKAVTIPADYTQQGVSFHTNWMGAESVWQIEWRKESRASFHEIRVTVNADTGEIAGINVWNHNMDQENPPFPPKYNFDGAVDIAKDYINSIFPNKTDELYLDPMSKEWFENRPFRDYGYANIRFQQKVNDIPFEYNSVNVAIDGNGEVVSFDYSWYENVDFDSPEGIISQEEADAIFADSIDMELRYIYEPYRMNGSKDVHLAYVPKSQDGYRYYSNYYRILNAKTGEWVQPNGMPDQSNVKVPDGPLAEKPSSLPDYGGKTLTQEQALERVKSTFNLPGDVELSRANYMENSYREGLPIWSFDFQQQGNSRYPSFLQAEVNAETGEVLQFYNDNVWRFYEENKEVTVNVSEQQALEKATEFVKKVAGNRADHLYATAPANHYFNDDQKPRFYNVFFIRKENGIPVQGQGVEVMISSETGEVFEYRLSWNDLKLPSADQVIQIEKAKELFLEDTHFGLNYHVLMENNGVVSNKDREAIVVYQPSYSPVPKYLDAVTGIWMNSETGKPLYEPKEATDIEGHWAEAALKAMVDYDIMEVVDGKLNPNAKLTRAELIEIFVKAIGDRYYYYDGRESLPFSDVAKDASYYPYLYQAIDRNLIDKNQKEFKPDELVDREYMAVLVVKGLGYDRLAKVDGIFSSKFKDSNQITAKGHVGLVHQLGIMQGSTNGNFMPKKEITKAEAAMTLYRFLEKRSEL
ncbi:YcdB/YcdC domain-containing protein [Anaerobacillus sp. MEB173]|uniref:YcdB/YcdC domain-containing protein n=1 Tax=Anaerobacillus sp. MEB173 TaxID=3383345 RepID=UPI003F929A3B